MKTERRIASGHLWNWLLTKLPRSFEARRFGVGYGYMHCIYTGGCAPSNFLQNYFEAVGDPIATVYDNEVEVHHPQYVSDFEDLLRKYEAETKIEPKLVYWEGA